MQETAGLPESASHLGLQHSQTHVIGNEVHHVFTAPDGHAAMNGSAGHIRHMTGTTPDYMGQNDQGFHVLRFHDQAGRPTFLHVKQDHFNAAPNVNIPKFGRSTVAVTRPVGAPNPLSNLSGAVSHGIKAFKQNLRGATQPDTPRYPQDSGADIHSLAASHGIAAYDTRSRWQPNISGAPGHMAHFSHLMTANNPQAQISRLHQSVAQAHPTTDIKYNRVHVGGVLKHVYSFQHHDGKALHTVTVTKPALERPGGKLDWQ